MYIVCVCSFFAAQNCRKAEQLTVHFLPEGLPSAISRSCPLRSYSREHIVGIAWAAINKGHSQPRSIELTGRTPLMWFVHECMELLLTLVDVSFTSHIAAAAAPLSLSLFLSLALSWDIGQLVSSTSL